MSKQPCGPHPLVSDTQTIRFRSKGGRLATVTLPEDKSAEEICRVVRDKVLSVVTPEEFTEPERPAPLTGNDCLLLFSMVALYVYGAALLFQRMLVHGGMARNLLSAFPLVLLLLGPGTIGCLLLAMFSWQRFRQLLPFAYAFNMLAVLRQ